MDGASAKKSTSLETLVIQNIANVNELKAKLNDIIQTGRNYEYDVSSCLKSLISSSDQEIVLLCVKAVSELAKCEEKRKTCAQKEIVQPILDLVCIEITSDRIELIKQCIRALGNLCCDCDEARNVILECDGVSALAKLLSRTLEKPNTEPVVELIKMFGCKTILNFAIGGQEFSDVIVQSDIVSLIHKILVVELESDDMNDDVISPALLIFNVINDNSTEHLYDQELNVAVLNVLRQTTNVEISELCLEHLTNQAENDSIKTLLALECGIHLVCSRLQELVLRYEAGELTADDTEVEAVITKACDLIIIVLTGDEAMHLLYDKGLGDVYLTVVKWLESTNYHLLTTSVLAIGNFARQDDYCTQMMDNNIFEKLLDIFETYNGFHVQMQQPSSPRPIEPATLTKVQHAVLSAIRNLLVPIPNKCAAAVRGRAAPALLRALPTVTEHHVAYKLLAAIRMLVDGQEAVAQALVRDRAALAAVARWAAAAECAGAAGEAPRLLAWTVKQLSRHSESSARMIVQVDGCLASLVNMLVSCHSVMQNEAILALTMLAIESLGFKRNCDNSGPIDYEDLFTRQVLTSEIGKHIYVLIEVNFAKMPVEVAENLLAYLDITSKKNKLATDYKQAKVQEALQKFMDTRNDFSEDLNNCILLVIDTISDNGDDQ